MDEIKTIKPTTTYAAISGGVKRMSTKDHSGTSSTAFPVSSIQSETAAAAAAVITQRRLQVFYIMSQVILNSQVLRSKSKSFT